MDSILADTKLSEVVTITEESEPILKALTGYIPRFAGP